MFAPALLTWLTLTVAVTVNAEPLLRIRDSTISFPIAKRVNTTSIGKIAPRDKARAQAFIHGRSKLQPQVVGSIPATNQVVDYVVSIQIGSPPTAYSLLVDSGSSNTWVTDVKYIQTSTSVQTQDSVSVTYGSGFMSGTEFDDKLTVSSDLLVFGQSIGVATDEEGFDDSDGVLGIGPADLTVGTLTPDTKTSIPTVTDNLFSQGFIQQNQVAISFEPTTDVGVVNGELTFGGTDSTKFTGSINQVPLTKTSPSNKYWGIDQQIRYGQSTNILSKTAGIVDTGTTLTLIATDALARYTAITGAVLDDTTTLLRISPGQFATLQSLFFVINGVTFEFTANAQIWPRALNTAIGGDADSVYLIIGDIGSHSGSGLDFINGMTWIERFYVVLDTTNKKVGIANTPFTRATTN